ncbi:MAG: type II toxin-antitoxin system Phd/YefM family antitoxin [Firmicutes bacterium]|nr:type II toxin-antitoxin system Phd/YefM family antitoxin [Bacillota bacterium]
MAIRIKSISDIRRHFNKVVESLREGPVFIAKNKRVRAIMLDIFDYYSLLEEIEILNELLRDVSNSEYSFEDDQMINRLVALDNGD